MPETDKTGTEEENFSLLCVPDGRKYGRKKSEMFQETDVECTNASEESPRSNSYFSDNKTFTVDSVFNKRIIES